MYFVAKNAGFSPLKPEMITMEHQREFRAHLISSVHNRNFNPIAFALCTLFENHRKSLIWQTKFSTTKGQFWRVFENLKLAIKQFCQIGQF